MSKIPFSIEYRPLIESGEYKVEIGREDPWPARIVCWDLNGDNIIAVVMNPEGREEGLIYTKQGKHNAFCPRIDSDLFIIIPEPELTESEDERIRKELIGQVEKSGHHPSDKARWLAWLEKQKEKKQTLDLPAGFYFIDQDGNKYYSKEFRYNNGTFTTTMKVKIEQKQEWSEEDKQVVDEIIGSLCDFRNLIIESDSHWVSNPKLKDISREIVWLKSLRPQPKVE